jgi:hypothetical protein
MLSVVMLSVVMLSVVMLNVVMLSVVAPLNPAAKAELLATTSVNQNNIWFESDFPNHFLNLFFKLIFTS